MNFSGLRIKKLSVKFLLALGTLLLISGAIVVESIFFAKRVTSLEGTNKELSEALVLVHKIDKYKNNFLEKEYKDKEFLTSGNSASLELHNDYVSFLRSDLDSIIDREISIDVKEKLDSIDTRIRKYALLFNSLTNEAYKIGNTTNSIFIDLENTIHLIEKSPVDFDRSFFHRIRNIELEFLYKNNVDKYSHFESSMGEFYDHLKKIDEENRFKSLVEREKLRDLLDLVNLYHNYFVKVVELEIKLGAIKDQSLVTDLEIEASMIIRELEDLIYQTEDQVLSGVDTSNYLLITLFFLQFIIIVITLLYFVYRLIYPIIKVKNIAESLSKGGVPELYSEKLVDEVGQTISFMNKLITRTESVTNFAFEIGKGNYDQSFEAASEEDRLGNALINMKKNLSDVRALRELTEKENKRRNWVSSGLASFVDVLRKNQNSIDGLSYNMVSQIVKYIGANQGSIYLKQKSSSDSEKDVLVLKGCFAYDKKKYINQEIELNEGLVGQCYIEKDTIYLKSVPFQYVTITSGLGEATASELLIVPLKTQDEIHGVIEFASFDVFEDHVIEFIEKIAESIASTLSSVYVNQRTKELLEDSQKMSQHMRDREEELKKNQDLLIATQADTERSLRQTNLLLEKYKNNEGMYMTEINSLKMEVKDANFKILCLKKDLEKSNEVSF